jgi:hypothetical protein
MTNGMVMTKSIIITMVRFFRDSVDPRLRFSEIRKTVISAWAARRSFKSFRRIAPDCP